MKKDSVVIGCIMGVLAVILLTALTVGLLLSGRWLYDREIGALQIELTSGLSREEIIENYDAVILFLSPFNQEQFSMPGIPASAGGVNHFEDVKAILNGLYFAGAAAFVLMVCIVLLFRKKAGTRSLLAASISSLALPAVMAGGIALNFDGFFVLFHKIFFTNDDWLFDPITDPVINILPSEYFMHCGIVLAVSWVLGGLVFLVLHLRAKKKRSGIPAT